MKAAVLDSQGENINIYHDVECIEPRPGEIKVRVKFCSLCHSDASVKKGVMGPLQAPIILGHEAAGIVHSVGAGVTHIQAGDHVAMTPVAPCGICYYCQRHQHSLCVNSQALHSNTLPDGETGFSRQGKPILRGLGVGGLAQYTIAQATGAIKIPQDIPLDVACVIGCAIQTGAGAVLNTANVEPGASVLITGLGGVGMAAVQGARIAGATTIVASDPLAERRQLALQLGASHVIDPAAEDLAARCSELSDGIGIDYAFETAGKATLIAQCVDLVRAGGEVTCVGSPDFDQHLELKHVVLFQALGKKLQGCLLGSCNASHDIPRMVRLWQSGQLNLDAMVTRRRPLEQVNEAFADLAAGIGIRTVLEIGD
jgi:S-(hydroxymethyl)glutathione dehydrogenase/alcohol dehydrogenase